MTNPKYSVSESFNVMRDAFARVEHDVKRHPMAHAFAVMIFDELNKTINTIRDDDPDAGILIGRYLSARLSLKTAHDLGNAIAADAAVKKAKDGY
jgi:hypothetical protein